MDEKTAGPSLKSVPSQKLKARLQLWHYSEQEGWSLTFNSRLASQAEDFVPPAWKVYRVESPEIPCLPGQTFVAIEAEFVHRTMPHNHRMALYEWNKLWNSILPLTKTFFAEIQGQVIIIRMMSPYSLQAGQSLFVSVDTCGPLRLRQKIVPTPRPKSPWPKVVTRCMKGVASAAALAACSYMGLMSPSSAVSTYVTLEVTSAIVDYIDRRRQSPGLFSEDPAQKVARTLEGYRRQYATWTDYMSQVQEYRCPDIGIKRLEACRSLLIEFGEFEASTLSHLNTDIEPSCQRKTRYRVAIVVGGCLGAACLGFVIGPWLLSSAPWWGTAGVAGVAGAASGAVGYFDPNRKCRELIQDVRDLFKSLKRTLHLLYMRMWVTFYQDVLGIPFTRLSEQDGYELLKCCGVDLTFIQEVGYQKALAKLTMDELRYHNKEFLEKFHELYRAVGQDMTPQDVPGED